MASHTDGTQRTVRTYADQVRSQHYSGKRIPSEGQQNAARSAAALAVGASLIIGVAGCSAPWGATADKTSAAPSGQSAANKSRVPSPSEKKTGDAQKSDSAQTQSNSNASTQTAPSDTYATNPHVKLPTKIAPSIPNDATIISPQYAQLSNGDVVDLQTGQKVTNPNIVGSEDAPADPLAKSDGSSFIPTQVGSVREQMRANGNTAGAATGSSAGASSSGSNGSNSSSSSSSSKSGTGASDFVEKSDNSGAARGTFSRLIFANESEAEKSTLFAQHISLPNNSYGAHWGTYDGTPAFFMKNGTLFAQQAKGVVDVSAWQGDRKSVV